MLPNWRCAAARASSGAIPRSRFSSIMNRRWASISSSSSLARLRLFPSARSIFDTHRRMALSLRRQNLRHRDRESLPFRRCPEKFLPPSRRETVIPRAASVGRRLPLSGDPFPLEKTLERRVQRAVIDEKFVVRLLLQKLRNPVGVIGLELQALEDQHLEGSLKQSKLLVIQ